MIRSVAVIVCALGIKGFIGKLDWHTVSSNSLSGATLGKLIGLLQIPYFLVYICVHS